MIARVSAYFSFKGEQQPIDVFARDKKKPLDAFIALEADLICLGGQFRNLGGIVQNPGVGEESLPSWREMVDKARAKLEAFGSKVDAVIASAESYVKEASHKETSCSAP